MRAAVFRLFLILLVLAPATLTARTAAFKGAVNSKVAAAKRIGPQLGVLIVEVESGQDVYSYNAETPRIVASNTKLFTSAAALHHLGPGFFFETGVEVRGTVDSGTLLGDLAVIGGGDPNLSGRHYNGDSFGPFREWAAALAGQGIRRIAGDLVLVNGLFDDQFVHPDWPKDQLTRWYEAPVSALSFNDNCVLVKVRPGAAAGRPAKVEVVPEVPIFQVHSKAGTTSRTRWAGLGIDRGTRAGDDHILKVTGNIYRRTESIDKWVAVADPVRYFGAALRQAFAEEGIAIDGVARVVEELPGEGWRRVHTHRSDLLTTLEIINKRSQNFYSEAVIKLLGARLCGQGNWERGTQVVREMLADIGISNREYSLADGSGMSRNNRFSPRHVTDLLRHMFFHTWGAEFLQTLPYSGEEDLSWSRRLAKAPYRGNVLAKTGTLNGVSTLSGYAKARSGKVYAFSILLNGVASNSRAKTAQDNILRAVIDNG